MRELHDSEIERVAGGAVAATLGQYPLIAPQPLLPLSPGDYRDIANAVNALNFSESYLHSQAIGS